MKIIVKMLSGENYEFILDANTNIRELRAKIATAANMPCEMLNIANITDKNRNRLCCICIDDSADEKLIDFIRGRVNNPQLQIDELQIFVKMDLGPGQYRTTAYNPHGYSAYHGAISNPGSPFFQSANRPEQAIPFSVRLKNIGMTAANVPDHLCDPITNEIMDNPVIASNQRTFDLGTLEKLNYIDPFSHQPLSRETMANLKIRAELEEFVSKNEAEKKLADEKIAAASPASASGSAAAASVPTSSSSATASVPTSSGLAAPTSAASAAAPASSAAASAANAGLPPESSASRSARP